MTSPNEDELQVRKMEKLSETYFDNELDSEIYFPVSTLKTSQFYPGGKELHHQTPALPSFPLAAAPIPAANKPTEVKTCFILFIGFSGLVLGLIGLTFYSVVQIPDLRSLLGLNYTADFNDASGDNRTAYLILEIVEVSFTSILGILVNILLLYGVLRKSKLFLLPWLAFHVFLILAAILTTIVVLVKAKPMIYRLFFLVPLGCGLYFIFCWAKVFDYYFHIKKTRIREGIAKSLFVTKYQQM